MVATAGSSTVLNEKTSKGGTVASGVDGPSLRIGEIEGRLG